jgi:hypothetical protein
MLALSSHTEQWENRKSKVEQNIKFILSHFKEPIFPRIITSRSTKGDETQFKVVYNEEEMLRTYEESKFIDCRVSIYRSSLITQKCHDDQNPQVADLIFFDIYKPIFMRESAQIKASYAILQAIKQILNGKPTILKSIDSFHIYQPIEPNSLDRIKKFIDNVIAQYPELQLVLRFPERIFDSFPQGEKLQHPSMLLIPGTFDLKNIEKREEEHGEIMLIQKWDGYRPRIISPIFDSLLKRYRYDHQTYSKAFLICKWCFWCASNLSTRNVITKCPVCDNNDLNSIPVSDSL